MSKPTIARRRDVSSVSESEVLRRRLIDGSLNLRGVAAALEYLGDDLDAADSSLIDMKLYLPKLANILHLLARDVEREADTIALLMTC